MKDGPDIAFIAALIGDPARANMLTALMSGKALTVSELAEEAGVTIQTASSHLSKLNDGGLLRPRKQGRHKYFSFANEHVAYVLESLMGLAAGSGYLRKRTGPKDKALRKARVCYNHLAGDMGIQMFGFLFTMGYLVPENNQITLSDRGADFVVQFGIDLDVLRAKKSVLCRECLDWSERRSHLAGNLGRAFLVRFQELDWVKRQSCSRAVIFSVNGQKQFEKSFSRQPN